MKTKPEQKIWKKPLFGLLGVYGEFLPHKLEQIHFKTYDFEQRMLRPTQEEVEKTWTFRNTCKECLRQQTSSFGLLHRLS